MATPIVEQIAQALKTRLETITTDNGYEITVSSVVRPSRASRPTYGNYQIVMIQTGATLEEQMGGGYGFLTWTQGWNLLLAIKPADDSTTPLDQLNNTFLADVIKCVMANDHTWGGLAVDTNLGDVTWFESVDDFADGYVLEVNVTYRVDRDDPYTAR